MRPLRSFLFLLAGAAMLLAGGGSAPAATIVSVKFDSASVKLAGDLPKPTGTYAEASFTYLNARQVEVAFSVSAAVAGMYVDSMGFQFASELASAPLKKGEVVATYSKNAAVHGTGNAKFSSLFDFPASGSGKKAQRLEYLHNAVYVLTFSKDLLPNLSNLFAAPTKERPYIAAAHLAGYSNSSGKGGSSVGLAGHLASVPEPGTIVMSTTALVGIALTLVRKRKGEKGRVDPI